MYIFVFHLMLFETTHFAASIYDLLNDPFYLDKIEMGAQRLRPVGRLTGHANMLLSRAGMLVLQSIGVGW